MSPPPGTQPVAAARSATRPAVRRWRDGGWLVGGALLLLLSALPVHANRVSTLETSAFRLVNDTVTVPFALVWPVMQLGNILVVPVAALAAALARRFRLAASILLGGAVTYYLAKVVKRFVTRGRPPDLLADVNIHGAAANGLGFVSGHAGVVALIAVVAWPYLGRRSRWTVGVLAVIVSLARMYVGAHLPLDVVGGAALGIAVGGVVRLALGRPVRCF